MVGALTLIVLLVVGATPVKAQPDVPPTWGGTLLDRPRLTGSWFGLRDEMGKKGIVLDLDFLGTPQGVVAGGRETEAQFWGNAEYTLNVDTQKLGLWPRGVFRVTGNTGFGDNVFNASGALVPVNLAGLIPRQNTNASGLMGATFTQFLSAKFGLTAGKIDLIDSFQGEFSGNYRTQFMNTGLAIPSTFALVPISAFGGGGVVLPTENILLTALAVDPDGTPTNNDISEAFDGGATVVASGKLTIKPFGLLGHQQVGGMWSNKSRLSLIQDPSNIERFLVEERFPRLADPGPALRRILQRFFPELLVPVQPANREGTTWTVFYAFDQYFWHPDGDQKRGIGVFFSFGASDGDANPIKYSYAMGIGGKGVVPRRPLDSFGIGWARTQLSNNFVPFLRQKLNLGLDKEDAVELYYNASLTRWLGATLDLQIIDQALNKTLDSSGRLTNMGTAVVAALRLYARF